MIENKVDKSGLLQFDLEQFHVEGDRVLLDIKPWLFQELILKEKDFREFVKNHDWQQYAEKLVAVTCSADAIVPTWAYMLISTELAPYAKKVVFGNLIDLETQLYAEAIQKLNPADYEGQRVVVKGCSKHDVPVSAYVQLTAFLRPVAKSIMYGEPCSTVPLFKRKSV